MYAIILAVEEDALLDGLPRKSIVVSRTQNEL